MRKEKIYIIGAARTAFGKLNGQLSHIRPDDLAVDLLQKMIQKYQIDRSTVDKIFIGCSNQAGEDNRNIARMISILADLPFKTQAITLNSLCTSGLESIISSARCIALGEADLIISGGVENMSRSPIIRSSTTNEEFDSTIGWRFINPKIRSFCPTYSMPETTEQVCKTLKIDKNNLDDLAFESRAKYQKAAEQNVHQQDMLPHTSASLTDQIIDEPHRNLSKALIKKLPFIVKGGQFITLGNAARIGDGAGLVMLASEKYIQQHQIKPLACIESWASTACHPNEMSMASTFALQQLMSAESIKTSTIDAVEHAESFSLQSYLINSRLQIDYKRINMHGGNLSSGNPISAGPMRALVRMAHLLSDGLQRGLVASSAGLGQGTALLLKKV